MGMGTHLSRIALVCYLISAPAMSEEVGAELGREEFFERCAVCHGENAKGRGPVAKLLRIEPADLTRLTIENGGEFPFERVYQVIDGRAQVPAHGPRKMPVWGYEYQSIWEGITDPTQRRVRAEYFITGRILSLIRYLETIQQE